MNASRRERLLVLDQCLLLLENALAGGQGRIDAKLGIRLRELLSHAGLIADHRLEGRRTERVLDDIFELQARVLGTVEDEEHSAAG
jgi:hypothetical protein